MQLRPLSRHLDYLGPSVTDCARLLVQLRYEQVPGELYLISFVCWSGLAYPSTLCDVGKVGD